MSRIHTLNNSYKEIDHNWLKRNHDQITSHPAWIGSVSELEANHMLEGKNAFTYVLRSAGKEHAYFISFVQPDGPIKHQYFTLEFDRKGWYYKNGMITGLPTEITSASLDELIPQMMHCSASECKTINKLLP